MDRINFLITETGQVEGLDLSDHEPAAYCGYTWKADDPEGWRKFYRGMIVPHVAAAFVDYTGFAINCDDMHSVLKDKFNGGVSTVGMSVQQWRSFRLLIQSYTINALRGHWPF